MENVYISAVDRPLGSSYKVIVRGKRVNVNAVTLHTDGIVQDYALVISSSKAGTSLGVVASGAQTNAQPWVMTVTNGVPLLYQRVGANSPLLGGTNGTDSQWRFFTFTNPSNNTPYVAFVTFMPPNVSTARNTDADIDMYVSTESGLTNLDGGAIARSLKSLSRGGTEVITLSNSAFGNVYYIGVKAEDQKAAEFGFMAVASSDPFSEKEWGWRHRGQRHATAWFARWRYAARANGSSQFLPSPRMWKILGPKFAGLWSKIRLIIPSSVTCMAF